jgi:hypothetical protein
MFYYTYKIILLKGSLAGHYYLGQHSTNRLDDNYTGSGRIIRDYFKKYGKIEHQTYIKETIAFYNSQEELNNAEYVLIGDKYNTDDMCINLRAGGNQQGVSEITRKKMSQWERPHWTLNEEQKQHISEGHKGITTWNKGGTSWNKGKHLTLEHSKHLSESLKGRIGPKSILGKHRVYREDGSFYFE